MAPPRKKYSPFFDPKIASQDRLTAFQRLSPQEQKLLTSVGYKPGSIPTDAQMDALMAAEEDLARKALWKACANARKRRDVASVNDILAAMKVADILGLGQNAAEDDQLLDLSEEVMWMILQELEVDTFLAFRDFPSSENYNKCIGAIRRLDLLGIDDVPGYPVSPWPKCKILPPLKAGPYVVVRGDTLSKISKHFYGEENLWDAIYESNGYEGHPDRIFPGYQLMIYSC